MMYWEFFAVCLLLNKVRGHSYLSSVLTGGRPILRAGGDEPSPIATLQPPVKEVEPLWVSDLRARIERLVSRHGYEGAKPFIKKTVDETQKKQLVLLDVKGESEVVFEYEPKHALRSGPNSPGMTGLLKKEADPEWLAGLKLYIKALINRYGKQSLDPHVRPVIENIEKEHSVIITDIDDDSSVNIEGEVFVKYSKKLRPRTRSPYGVGRQGDHDSRVTVLYEK